jgi:D-aminopeptidase
MRARDLGIIIGSLPTGPHNAITDVSGITVGMTTIIEGDGPLTVGRGPIRTGVTVIIPHQGNVWREPLFAAPHRLNGNGELTGLEWIRESGTLMSPIGLTNTHSVGVVRDALVQDCIARHSPEDVFWALPVVGETYDGLLNDINGLHVKPEHVKQAMRNASSGPVAEGGVGSGTGMICHGFKGGIGTASRVVPTTSGGYTVGVLVQANHGERSRLQINGVPVGRAIPASVIPEPWPEPKGAGSIIIIVATDAPLIPTQCQRLAQRAALGVARTGGAGEHTSGDIFLAFATGNRNLPASEYSDVSPITVPLTMLSNTYINDLFYAAIEATEEAIVNAMVAATTMIGRDGFTAHQLDHKLLIAAMNQYEQLNK